MVLFDSFCLDICPIGSYAKNGICFKCSENCDKCDATGKCLACRQGTNLNSLRTCVACPAYS